MFDDKESKSENVQNDMTIFKELKVYTIVQ